MFLSNSHDLIVFFASGCISTASTDGYNEQRGAAGQYCGDPGAGVHHRGAHQRTRLPDPPGGQEVRSRYHAARRRGIRRNLRRPSAQGHRERVRPLGGNARTLARFHQ